MELASAAVQFLRFLFSVHFFCPVSLGCRSFEQRLFLSRSYSTNGDVLRALGWVAAVDVLVVFCPVSLLMVVQTKLEIQLKHLLNIQTFFFLSQVEFDKCVIVGPV